MKKLLALLLAGLMLIGFGVGTSAQEGMVHTPEELEAEEIVSQQEPEAEEVAPQATQAELEAEGRALLVQTMEDLRGDYIIQGHQGQWMHSGSVYRTSVGNGMHEIHYADKILRVCPVFNCYFETISSKYYTERLRLLKPKTVSEDAPILVTGTQSSHLNVTFDGVRYQYRDGKLNDIYNDNDRSFFIITTSFSKSVDLSLFSIEGMRDVTSQADLETLGRELLMQTMEDLRGDYTLGSSVVHSNGNYAFISNDESRELHIGGEILQTIPGRNAYYKISKSQNADTLRKLTPKEVTASTAITVSRDEDKGELTVTIDGIRYVYNFKTGECFNNFRKGADLSVFSLDGLSETSALKARLWDLSDSYWKAFRMSAEGILPTLTNIFAEMMGVPVYPLMLLVFFGCLLISPVMLILRLFL